MDHRKLIDILRATIDPNQRQQAEEQLEQVRDDTVWYEGLTCGRPAGHLKDEIYSHFALLWLVVMSVVLDLLPSLGVRPSGMLIVSPSFILSVCSESHVRIPHFSGNHLHRAVQLTLCDVICISKVTVLPP